LEALRNGAGAFHRRPVLSEASADFATGAEEMERGRLARITRGLVARSA
jgi:hypothetical protein